MQQQRLRERTCVGCRAHKTQHELLRYAVDGRGHLRPDPLRRRAGRGVYTCGKPSCLRAAAERGGFARGLRRRVTMEDRALASAVHDALFSCRDEILRRFVVDGRAQLADDGVVSRNVTPQLFVEWEGHRWRVAGQKAVRQMAQMERLISQSLGSEDR